MTEQERISQIEDSLSGLEKQIHTLRIELDELKEARQAVANVSVTEHPIPADIVDAPVPVPTPIPVTTAATASAPVSEPVQTSTPAPGTDSATTPMAQTTPKSVTAQASGSMPKTATASAPAKKKSTSGFEENLGGKVMGIVAAVLIFIGLFLFGSMLYERLGDTARIAILFLVSFLLLGAGLFLERKRESWFTTSLIGCGFGAVYISLFITGLYYERFEKEVLYFLILFWLIGIGLYVFHRQSNTVALLGQIGIAFSVILGSFGIDSAGQFTFLCIYFAVLSLLYLWIVLWRFLPDTEKKPYSWIQLTAFGLNLLQLWALAANYGNLFGEWGDLGGKNWTAGILLCLYSLVQPLFFLLRQRTMAGLSLMPCASEQHRINDRTFPIYKAGIGSVWIFTLHQFLVWGVFSVVSGTLFEAYVPEGLFQLAGLLISYLILQFFGPTGIEGRGATILNAVTVIILVCDYDYTPFLSILIFALFCAVTLLFGMFGTEYPVRSVRNACTHRWEYLCKEEKGRSFDKFAACVYLLPILCSYSYADEPFVLFLITVFGIAFFAGSFVFLYHAGKDHRYADGWKTVLYIFGMIYVGVTAGFLIGNATDSEFIHLTALLTVLVLFNGVAYYSGFRKKLTDATLTDTTANAFVRIVHNILWIWGIVLLHSGAVGNHPFLCIWLILLTLYLCGSGMYEQYKTHNGKPGLGIYFGLRVTFYMIAVITAFDGIEGYVISCILLVLAILFVLAGFPLRLAPLRIYGLCLAMFAVVKLLMIDVEHDNSMETVLCFLGAGVLCFAINFIYNYVKKRFQNNID